MRGVGPSEAPKDPLDDIIAHVNELWMAAERLQTGRGVEFSRGDTEWNRLWTSARQPDGAAATKIRLVLRGDRFGLAFYGCNAQSAVIAYNASLRNSMAMLTVRNLDEAIKSQLRIKAAQHGCSMEEEARRILREALLPDDQRTGLGTRLHHQIVELSGGAELELSARSLPRSIPFAKDD